MTPVWGNPSTVSIQPLFFSASTDVADTGRPALRIFTDKDGLPQNAITALEFDRKGYLWAGTKDGPVCYNGKTWKVVNLPIRNTSNQISVIRATSDGGLWFGTAGGGLALLKNGNWSVFSEQSGLPSNFISAVVESHVPNGNGALWVGTEKGLVRWRQGTWEILGRNQGFEALNIKCLAETAAETGNPVLWVGTDGPGLIRIENNQWTIFNSTNSGLTNSNVRSLLASVSPAGKPVLWVGTNEELCRLADGSWSRVTLENGFSPKFIFSLLETATPAGERILWVGHNQGLLRLSIEDTRSGPEPFRVAQGKWANFDKSVGLAYGVWCLAVERATQTLWIGLSGAGLARWKPGGWVSFTTEKGLVGNPTYSILELPEVDGASAMLVGGAVLLDPLNRKGGNPTLWALSGTTEPAGCFVSRFAAGHWTRYRIPVLATALTQAFFTDHQTGDIWLGTGDGTARFHQGRWIPVTNRQTTCVGGGHLPDGSPVIWLGHNDGFSYFQNESLTSVALPGGEQIGRVRCVLETFDSAGRFCLWVGTENGLYRQEAGRWEKLTTNQGLVGNRIMCLKQTVSPEGKTLLWVGTGSGLCWANLAPGSLSRLNWHNLTDATVPALPNNTVYRIEEDARQRLYLSTNKGVARLTPGNSGAETPSGFAVETFTTEDGLPSNECNTGASMVDSQGRIWVGTIGGAALFDPATEPPTPTPAPALFEKAGVESGSPAEFQPLRTDGQTSVLGHNQNHVVFEFSLLRFFRETETRFRTQLVGLETAPTQWTTETAREFAALPSGTYCFQVWARDYAGTVSGPIQVTFEVRPAPWLAWWAYVGYVITLGGIGGFAGYRVRVRRLMARQKILSEQVARQTKSLVEEKERTLQALAEIQSLNRQLEMANRQEREKALQAVTSAQQAQLQMLRYQINPHFLFNVLTTVWGMVDEDPERTRQMVAKLSKFLRYSLNTATSKEVSLKEEVEAVQNYLDIQKIRFEDQIEVTFDIAPEALNQKLPPFLLQPLVENAVKYGMQTSDMPLQVMLSVRVGRKRLWLRVVNSGCWVDVTDHAKRADSTNIGLNNIRERLTQTFGKGGDLRFFRRNQQVWARIRIRL
ncbi:MAG: histidine kinase [Blastocatellia bacterium]|nr:histidine kinase [Blastocatellia bacterium]